VSALAKTYAPKTVGARRGFGNVNAREMPKARIKLFSLIVRRLVTVFVTGGRAKRSPLLCMDRHATIATIGNFPYVKTNGLNTYRLLYEPDRSRLNRLLWKGLLVLRDYRTHREGASSQWRGKMSYLRGRDSWEQIFRKGLAQTEVENQVE